MNETFYDKSPEQLERRFSSERGAGLSPGDIAKNRRTFGANNVYTTPARAFFGYRKQIPTDYASLLLLGAALLGMVFELPVAAGAIIAMLAVNYAAAVFTFVKAQKVLEGMTAYSLPTAKVMRGGRLSLVDMRSLVPGDIIFLSAGDIVPADCRIFQSDGLYINEGTLTGMQNSVKKDANFAVFKPGLPLSEQANMAFATTIVTAGSGRCMVVATGSDTQAVQLGKTKPVVTHENLKILKTLRGCCSTWSLAMLAVIFVVTAADLFVSYSGQGIYDVFLTGLSLAAAAMAELYVAFGYIIVGCGIFAAMKRRHDVNVGALIKNAEKLEDLRGLTHLIIPKDGMITQQNAVAEKIYIPRRLLTASDRDRVDSLRAVVTGAVISTGIYGQGLASLSGSTRRISPEEEALIDLAQSLGLYNSSIDRAHPIIEHKPEGGASKFETTLTLDSDHHFMAVCRGEADAILNSCEYYTQNGRIFRMSADDRLEFSGAAASLTKNSYKVVAVASGVTGYNNLQRIGAIQSDLTFEGFIAIREPLQPRVAQTIQRCKAAGIKVIMTTDRYTESDKYLAVSVGLIEGAADILTEEKAMSQPRELLRVNLPLYSMYCGLSPARLEDIVGMLREDGARVGLLAGGMSGALLLKKADVGFAQAVTISPKAKKTGIDIRTRSTPAYSRIAGAAGKTFDSEALKFISDVVVSDADANGHGGFGAVVSALEYARTIYRNLARMVRYLATAQFARLFLVLGAIVTGMRALTPVQILFGGLILDFTAIIVTAFSRPPHDALTMRDDAQQALAHPFVTSLRPMLFALFQAAITMAAPKVMELCGWEVNAGRFSTIAFVAFTICQLITLAELASDRSLFSANLRLSLVSVCYVIGVVGLLAAILAIPQAAAAFGCSTLRLADGIAVAAICVLVLAVHEVYKLIRRK
ncbi:MAG: cation-transporting P-type ATPase [Clostridia bacterium]|nr:cation-transporting P-type ATPase [Clostridia bacterium]